MSGQHFRLSKVGNSFTIFPFPPIKEKKWLIIEEDESIAKNILHQLSSGELASPLENQTPYTHQGLHKDGKTPTYSLKK